MNKLRAQNGYKAIVVAVLIISLITGVFSVVGFGWMASEEYYDIDGIIDPDDLRLKLSEVPFEETWTPWYEVHYGCDWVEGYLDIELLSEDTEVDAERLLTQIELDDGRTLLVSKAVELLEDNEHYDPDRFGNVSLSLTDEEGNVIFENTPAVRDNVYESYIIIGFDSKGELIYRRSDNNKGIYTDCFDYQYISCAELTEYAVQYCPRLFEPAFTYVDMWHVSSSDVSPSDAAMCFSEAVYDVEDLYGNAAFILMEKNGDLYAVPYDAVLADYAWSILRSGYYNYGYDESLGEYYVTKRTEEFITPSALLKCRTSLVGEEDFNGEMKLCRSLYEVLYPHRVTVIVLGVLSVIACIVCFILMLCYAGWQKDSDKPQLQWEDKIPLEIFCVIFFLTGLGLLVMFEELTYGDDIMLLLLPVVGGAFVALCIEFLMSLARRIKTRTLLRNTVCVHAFRLAKKIISALPSIWVVVLGGIVYGVVSLLCIISMNEAAVVLWAVVSLALFAAVCLFDFQLGSIIKTAEKISNGDAECRVDEDKLLPQLKKHGESINRIGDSVQNAVDERLRSERMKTDLIANVSHDIKTPLTSVINYIDLLRYTDISDPAALEYISVLERQSVRLKRLVQDIVDASKASSGCISAQLQPVDLRELLDQAAAEYADRMAANSIIPVVSVDEDCTGVLADGRLLWRVFDNLLSNICKYSQPGTRAYIKASCAGNNVEIVFRNISSEALDIPAETLMERFVRGDRSRHTDGSGLGLSIAQSLTELQNGHLRLSIEGDLFRAAVTLPACELPESSAAEEDISSAVEETAGAEYQPQPEDGWLELPTLGSSDNTQA